jgi:hypothetical protein
MIGRKFFEAMVRMDWRWGVVKFEPQGLEGLFIRIAEVLESIRLSRWVKSICQFSLG